MRGRCAGRRVSQLDGVSLRYRARAGSSCRGARARRLRLPTWLGSSPSSTREALSSRTTRGLGAPGTARAELGDLLFTCVNLARHMALDPETALRHATRRLRPASGGWRRCFVRRRHRRGLEPAAMDAAWDGRRPRSAPGPVQPARRLSYSSSSGTGGGLRRRRDNGGAGGRHPQEHVSSRPPSPRYATRSAGRHGCPRPSGATSQPRTGDSRRSGRDRNVAGQRMYRARSRAREGQNE